MKKKDVKSERANDLPCQNECFDALGRAFFDDRSLSRK